MRNDLPAFLALVPLLTAALYGPEVFAADLAAVEFNRDIRPIFSDVCYTCHGPDKAARKSELRLDTQEGAFRDIDGRKPIVAGQPQESELFLRITSDDANERMPPPSSGRQLTKPQIDLIRRWIEQGAKWQKHWSFIPPRVRRCRR